ncbi:MAG: transposase [Proteobacteria bacterium]|nr:transposase [Pseudomonadota bacterium]MDA1301591.1 transposase [Pseudomonadota bacterium]
MRFADMPRKRRFCPKGYPVHIIQRGHNREICFVSDEDIAAYANWLAKGAEQFSVQINGWVFMTNHVHILATPQADNAISLLMQYIGRQYVRYFNFKFSRSGSLFEDRFKSSVVQSERYLLTCLQYIELNPVRAGMVKDPGDYTWSSYSAHGFGRTVRMWTPHPIYKSLADSQKERTRLYRELIGTTLGAANIAKIRHCTNKGLVLGTEKFREQFQSLTEDIAPS